MENSFFEFCKSTDGNCSESDVIDDSIAEEDSFNLLRKHAHKNRTEAVISESDEASSESDDEVEIYTPDAGRSTSKIKYRSDDEIDSSTGSGKKSSNTQISDSENEAEGSPEMVPRGRPKSFKIRQSDASLNSSVIGHRRKKCMVLQDSDDDISMNEVQHNTDKSISEIDIDHVNEKTLSKNNNNDVMDVSEIFDIENNPNENAQLVYRSEISPDPPDIPVDSDTSKESNCSNLDIPVDSDTSKESNCSTFDAEKYHLSVNDISGEVSTDLKNNIILTKAELDSSLIEEIRNMSVDVITLSSDEEDKKENKSPNTSKPKSRKSTPGKQTLIPESYPNQGVVYVKKQIRDNELNKLEGLREDLHNVKSLLASVGDLELPDGGAKLMQRLKKIENDIRKQSNRVAAMVVEPENPTADEIAKDGYENKDLKGLSWAEIQAASNKVQPKMFGKQAMATHVVERTLTLERLHDLHQSLASRPSEKDFAPQPKAIHTKMMPHQLHALAWLRWRETQRPRGGILADDMGVGKTLTMISLIASCKEGSIEEDEKTGGKWKGKGNSKSVRGGTLVVCPASLLQQWSDEVTTHCTSRAMSVYLHHGAARVKHAYRLSSYDVVVTTYNTLRLQLDEGKDGVLSSVHWSRVILDEAHCVRNYKSQTSNAVCNIEADKRWCLTGTPVHNKDLDMFALLKFLRCSPFDDITTWKKWIDNKSIGGQERMTTIMQCILLRRTKQQLQEAGQLENLPKKIAHEVQVTLTKEEMNVYQKVLVFSKTLFAQYLHQRAEKQAEMYGGLVPKIGKDDPYSKMHKRMIALHGAKPVKSHEILVLLLRLRQVCCHCGLIAAMLDDGDNMDEITEDAGSVDLLKELKQLSLEDKKHAEDNEENLVEGTSVGEAIRSVLSLKNPVFNLNKPSSKIQAVMDCLNQNVSKGEKAVVVSQWASVLRLVEMELRNGNIQYVAINGSVPVKERSGIVSSFNDPHSKVQVMLLSLNAGGVGLNLCGGNHLLLIDPHWNPQQEQQAQDRIYRVGQKRDVHIYRFLCIDTLEQTIQKLQKDKLDLARNLLTGARETNGSKLSMEDLKTLFHMGS